MDELNSDDHYIYYCGQESLRRNGVALTVNRRVWNEIFGCSLKMDRMISVYLQGMPFNITVIQAYAPTTDAEEGEVNQFYKDLWDVLELTPKKRCPFHDRSLKFKSRKARDTWATTQVWLWSTKWSRAKANRILPREWTGHSKHLFPTTQETTLHMDITKWSILKSDWFILFAAEDREALHSQQKQDRELTVAQIMSTLLKIQASTEESRKNHLAIQVWPVSNPLRLYSEGYE